MLKVTYAPLPSAAEYLERIGYSGDTRPTLENLHQLVRCHQMNVPFEDLDSNMFRRPVSLDVNQLFQKIVREKRGGYCFEMNGLFVTLLRDLGYEAYSCFSRVQVFEGKLRPISHRGNIVNINGKKYFCDVGFGGAMAPFAVEISDERQTMFGETYWTEDLGDGWYMLKRISGNGLGDDAAADDDAASGAEKEVVVFGMLPALSEDFEAWNYTTYTLPESRFVKTRLVSIRTENGYVSLSDDMLKVRENRKVTERKITEAELPEVLSKYFGISIK